MKLFRLPRRAAAAARPRRQRSHLLLGTLGVGLLGFLAGCFLFFPTTLLRDWLVAEVAAKTPCQLEMKSIALRFPFGLTARDLVLSGGGLPTPVPVDRLQVTPRWFSFFSGNPGAVIEAELFGGELNGEIHRDGAFSARGQGLTLDLPLGEKLPLTVAGNLRDLVARGALPLTTGTASKLQLTINELRLNGAKALGSGKDVLRLGTASLKATGQGNSFRIEELKCSGGDLTLEAGGSLLLATPPPQSRLNLTLNLQPTASFDPALKDLLSVFGKPARDGSLRLRLTGSLAKPSLQ
ncbi:hypothetical protein JCM30471_32040 [Desulfuromonas carbonis]|uniref:type II secretion system protein GspN n=1 Tax=Desulfuromonas sp. DDH964 TaxID=1823759 RepID=UPI00078C4A8E|nr:type II secretion system protein GspN [Desulfuromonas sp. DDH964]AMV71365.1 type II secretion system protein GspN [Desulfuromonas sp. DDH964]